MKVFIVTRGDYDDFRIAGIFSTREKAESYLNLTALRELKSQHPSAVVLDGFGCHIDSRECDFNEIDAIELDKLTPVQWEFMTAAQVYPNTKLSADYPKEFITPGRLDDEDDG